MTILDYTSATISISTDGSKLYGIPDGFPFTADSAVELHELIDGVSCHIADGTLLDLLCQEYMAYLSLNSDGRPTDLPSVPVRIVSADGSTSVDIVWY